MADNTTSPPYPEHDKLASVADQTQAIGEFLEWIASDRGAHLMVWTEWNEPTEVDCPRTRCSFGRRPMLSCPTCHGTGRYTRNVHHSDWLPVQGTVQDLLASWAGVDLAALEQEKRAMLAAIRGDAA